jgi:hypothetical protein
VFDIEKFVKLPAFLQFVGMFLVLGMLLVLDAHGVAGHVAKFVAFISLGVAFAGFLYDKLYTS